MRRLIICTFLGLLATQTHALSWREDAPTSVEVDREDTVWELSLSFFEDPGDWSQSLNGGKHHLYSGDIVHRRSLPSDSNRQHLFFERASDGRSSGLTPPLPLKALSSFYQSYKVASFGLDPETPHVIEGARGSHKMDQGDVVYLDDVREEGNQVVFRPAFEMDSNTVLMSRIGEIHIDRRVGRLGRAIVSKTSQGRVVRPGDIVLSKRNRPSYWTLSSPPAESSGEIVFTDSHLGEDNTVVAKIEGSQEVVPGDVFALTRTGRKHRDPRTGFWITLSDEQIGWFICIVVNKRFVVGIALDTKKTPEKGDVIEPIH